MTEQDAFSFALIALAVAICVIDTIRDKLRGGDMKRHSDYTIEKDARLWAMIRIFVFVVSGLVVGVAVCLIAMTLGS